MCVRTGVRREILGVCIVVPTFTRNLDSYLYPKKMDRIGKNAQLFHVRLGAEPRATLGRAGLRRSAA